MIDKIFELILVIIIAAPIWVLVVEISNSKRK